MLIVYALIVTDRHCLMLVVGVEVTSTVGGRFRRCYTGVVTDGLRRSVVPGG